jgi:hypothetical protein
LKITNQKVKDAMELKKYFESLDEKFQTSFIKVSLKTCIRYTQNPKIKDKEFVYETELKQNNTRMAAATTQLLKNSKSSALNDLDKSIPYWRY